jgi:hypothetical protein
MSNTARSQGEPDRSRISLSREDEVLYWTRALGVNEWELRNAMVRAGSSADEVRKFLRRS